MYRPGLSFRAPMVRQPRPLQWQARRFPSRIGSVPRPPVFASTRVNRGGFWFGGHRRPGFGFGFGFHHRHFPFVHSYFFAFPFFYTSPFFYTGYWDPFFDGYAGLSYGPFWNPYYSLGPYSYDLATGSATYSALSNQLNDLSAQVQTLQEQNDQLQADLEQQPYPYPGNTPAGNSAPEPKGPPTLLVFRDGHRVETQSYAIVGPTLWILSDQRATKIPVSDLDLDQTIKANQQRGLTFPVGHTDR